MKEMLLKLEEVLIRDDTKEIKETEKHIRFMQESLIKVIKLKKEKYLTPSDISSITKEEFDAARELLTRYNSKDKKDKDILKEMICIDKLKVGMRGVKSDDIDDLSLLMF